MADGVFKRGEIYWLDWSPSRGSEQRGHRPGLVISQDGLNRSSFATVTVAAVTTQVKAHYSRIAVTLPSSVTGEASQVLAFQVMTVDKGRLGKLAGTLTKDQMAAVDAALMLVWGLRPGSPFPPRTT